MARITPANGPQVINIQALIDIIAKRAGEGALELGYVKQYVKDCQEYMTWAAETLEKVEKITGEEKVVKAAQMELMRDAGARYQHLKVKYEAVLLSAEKGLTGCLDMKSAREKRRVEEWEQANEEGFSAQAESTRRHDPGVTNAQRAEAQRAAQAVGQDIDTKLTPSWKK